MWIFQFRKNYSPKIQKTLENTCSFPRVAGVTVIFPPLISVPATFPRVAGVTVTRKPKREFLATFPRVAGVTAILP